MTEITIKTKNRRPELSDKELEHPMELIFGMPLETHEYDGIGEDDEDYSVSGSRNLPIALPEPRIGLPMVINDAYLKYGRLCKSKIYDDKDLTELSGLVGCSTGQLERVFIGVHPLSEKLFKKINDVLSIGPYELKQNHAKIF